ncbi:unnamed protein product [Polarella glacialis]|uniref:Uncharacterized protein n=1 Tax=Polarella glacialis TaxID=89957 RepID=A0A813HGY6_POLGL|nr:unnamed protein product [Polarella glacialis]
MRRRLLQSDEESPSDGRGCCSCLGRFLCCRGSQGRCGGLGRFCAFVAIFSVTFWIGVTRNLRCNPEALANVEPPFGGELMPGNIFLVERKYFFQFTKLVDVYTENMTHIGYFYDIDLFFIMRFGFSDPSGRVWFEARYASFVSRFKPYIEYTLQRCDVGATDRPTELFQVKEVWWGESYWRCLLSCQRLFNLARREDASQIREVLYEDNFGGNPEANVSFDGYVVPTLRGKMNGALEGAGTGVRQVWSMNISNTSTGASIAHAKQHFTVGTVDQNFRVLSRWKVSKYVKGSLPNWVIGFMATLDDIAED